MRALLLFYQWEHTPGEAWVYLVILASIYILYILKNYIRCVIHVSRLNGPKTVPIIGNVNYALEENCKSPIFGKFKQILRD